VALSFTPFSDGNTVVASQVGTVIGDIENFVNVGIGTGELRSATFLRTHHIFKPDFYGAPAPRHRFETAETHYRLSGLDRTDRVTFHPDLAVDTQIPIPGMCATIKVPQECRCSIYANCYVYEAGGNADGNLESSDQEIAQIALFLGTTQQAGTVRRLYPGQFKGDDRVWARKNFSWATHLTDTLSPGILNIAFKMRLDAKAASVIQDETRAKHIYVRERSLVVDLFLR
jgi:hypothetical protein